MENDQNFICAQNFPEDHKVPKSEFYTLKKYDEHTYHFTMEMPTPSGFSSLGLDSIHALHRLQSLIQHRDLRHWLSISRFLLSFYLDMPKEKTNELHE